jgi:hypothetical protein
MPQDEEKMRPQPQARLGEDSLADCGGVLIFVLSLGTFCGVDLLTEEQILSWANAHFQTAGRWPNRDSGPIALSGGETWRAVDQALVKGLRA